MLSLYHAPECHYFLNGSSYTWLVPQFLCTVICFLQLPHRGHPLIAWLWWPGGLEPLFLQLLSSEHLQITWYGSQRVYNDGAMGLHIFAYFKSCCLRVWLPISLKLGADWDSSFWDTDRSQHTLNNWKLLKIKYVVWTITKLQETTKSRGSVEW